jgi:hypothetical protein
LRPKIASSNARERKADGGNVAACRAPAASRPEASNTSVADNTQSCDYYRRIGFLEKSGAVLRAALESLIALLQKTGELKADNAPEKLVMPGVTQLGPE